MQDSYQQIRQRLVELTLDIEVRFSLGPLLLPRIGI